MQLSNHSKRQNPPLAPRAKIRPKLRARVVARISPAEEAFPLPVAAVLPDIVVVLLGLEETDVIPTAPPAPVRFDTTSTC